MGLQKGMVKLSLSLGQFSTSYCGDGAALGSDIITDILFIIIPLDA